MMKFSNLNHQEQVREISEFFRKTENEIRGIKKEYSEILLESPLKQVIDFWIEQVTEKNHLSKETAANYQNYLKDLHSKGILLEKTKEGFPFTLQLFTDNSQSILEALLNYSDLSQQQKRLRLSALISFVNFLNQLTDGFIQKLSIPEEFKLR